MKNHINMHTILERREVEGARVDDSQIGVKNFIAHRKTTDSIDSKIDENSKDFSSLDLRSRVREITEYLKQRELMGVDFSRTNLKGANLAGVNLKGANLAGVNLGGAKLCRANLEEAKFCRANLAEANLRDADLKGANLRSVNFTRADLQGANLQGVDFRGANLAGANLTGANLAGANLGGADLKGANLRDVNMERVMQNAFSAMDKFDNYQLSYIIEKTLSTLSNLLETDILSDDQKKSMLKAGETPLSEELRTIADKIQFFLNLRDSNGRYKHYFGIEKEDKAMMLDFIKIIAEKEKEIKEKEVPASAPGIPSLSPSHESDDRVGRVVKRQRVGEGGARSD